MKFEDVCAENGLIPQAVPQMLDVRFRVIVRLAKRMEIGMLLFRKLIRREKNKFLTK